MGAKIYPTEKKKLLKGLKARQIETLRRDNPFLGERNSVIRMLARKGVSEPLLAEITGLSKRSVHRITKTGARLDLCDSPKPSLSVPVARTSRQNEIAIARYALIIECMKIKDRGKVAVAAFVAAYNTGHTHPQLFKTLGPVALKTIDKWRGKMKLSIIQIDALMPRHGQRRRGRRIVTGAEMAKMLFFALHPNQMSISECIRWTKKTLEKEGGVSPSSEATMRRALMDWRETHLEQWIFSRSAEKAGPLVDEKKLRKAFDAFHSRLLKILKAEGGDEGNFGRQRRDCRDFRKTD